MTFIISADPGFGGLKVTPSDVSAYVESEFLLNSHNYRSIDWQNEILLFLLRGSVATGACCTANSLQLMGIVIAI